MLEWFERVGDASHRRASPRQPCIIFATRGGSGCREGSRRTRCRVRPPRGDESRSHTTSRDRQSGLQQSVVAWHQSSGLGAACHSLRRPHGAGAWAPNAAAALGWLTSPAQHLGDRRPCGILEVHRRAAIHWRRAGIVPSEGIELVSSGRAPPRQGGGGRRRGGPTWNCWTKCTTRCGRPCCICREKRSTHSAGARSE